MEKNEDWNSAVQLRAERTKRETKESIPKRNERRGDTHTHTCWRWESNRKHFPTNKREAGCTCTSFYSAAVGENNPHTHTHMSNAMLEQWEEKKRRDKHT